MAVPLPLRTPVIDVVRVRAGVVVALATVPAKPLADATDTVVTVPVLDVLLLKVFQSVEVRAPVVEVDAVPRDKTCPLSDSPSAVPSVTSPVLVPLRLLPPTVPVAATEDGVIAPRLKVMAGVVVAVATVPETPLAVVTDTDVTVPPDEGAVLVMVVVPLAVDTEIPVPPVITWAAVVSALMLVMAPDPPPWGGHT